MAFFCCRLFGVFCGVFLFSWLGFLFFLCITKNTKVTEQLGFGKMVALCEMIFRATKQK